MAGTEGKNLASLGTPGDKAQCLRNGGLRHRDSAALRATCENVTGVTSSFFEVLSRSTIEHAIHQIISFCLCP